MSVSSVAWQPAADLPFTEWLDLGKRLGVAGRGAGWWIGDWVRYGAVAYGGRYARAARVTGYDHKTLMNMVYVASRFEISRRREMVTWSHHAELASLDVDEQERWLDRIEREKLTVRQLRHELTREPRAAAAESARSRAARPSHLTVCPQCGFDLDQRREEQDADHSHA